MDIYPSVFSFANYSFRQLLLYETIAFARSQFEASDYRTSVRSFVVDEFEADFVDVVVLADFRGDFPFQLLLAELFVKHQKDFLLNVPPSGSI